MIASDHKLNCGMVLLLVGAIFAGTGSGQLFAQQDNKGAQPVVSSEPKETGLTQEAVEIGRVFGLPITNSMVVTWLTALILIIFARLATRNMQLVPDGAQNFWESLVEGLSTFLEGVIGRHLVDRTFWFFA